MLIIVIIIATISSGYFGFFLDSSGTRFLSIPMTILYFVLWGWSYKSSVKQQSFLKFSFLFWLVSCIYFISGVVMEHSQVEMPFNFLLLFLWFWGPFLGVAYYINEPWIMMWLISGVISGLITTGSLLMYIYKLLKHQNKTKTK